jgi:hypothetical protein
MPNHWYDLDLSPIWLVVASLLIGASLWWNFAERNPKK